MGADITPNEDAIKTGGSPAFGMLGWLRLLVLGNASADLSRSEKDLVTTSALLFALTVAGIAADAIWAIGRTGAFLLSFSTGALFIGAAGLIGAVVGLLFGIPRSIADTAASPTPPSPPDDKSAVQETRKPALATNTNLQEISDWLTKIIVGVGLVEAKQIMTAFGKLTEAAGKALPSLKADAGDDSAMLQAVAGGLILYGLFLGFLCGFLLSRLFLSLAFARVEQGMSELDQLREDKKRLTQTVQTVQKDKAELSQQVVAVTQQNEKLANSMVDIAKSQDEVLNQLYRDPPDGFTSALKQIAELFEQEVNARNPALWAYYACANGQAYAYALSQGKNATDPELIQFRAEALKGVRTALSSGDTWKPTLQQVWDKNYPGKTKSPGGLREDDLESFYDDPDFIAALQPKAPLTVSPGITPTSETPRN